MKKVIIAVLALVSVSCASVQTAPMGDVVVGQKLPVKNNPGVYKYYMDPLYKGRHFIIVSKSDYAIGDTLKFNPVSLKNHD